MLRCLLLAYLPTAWCGLGRAEDKPSQPTAEQLEHFEKRIRPLLTARCEACHSAAKGKTKGGLALDTRAGWLQGGENGSPIVPGKPEESLLIRAVRYDADGPQMPPEKQRGKLSDSEIAALVEWVKGGAHDPRIADARIGAVNEAEARRWWSFQPVRHVEPPAVEENTWPANEIDRFVLAALEEKQLRHASAAEKPALIRRATFDLTGLPPTPADVDAFVNDASPDALARVVDRLLASPQYGERWARHWLDVARYADYHDANPPTRVASCEITEVWRYRDWVVAALNEDLPFDQFIVHQIAGDLLPSPAGEEVYPAGLIATTFLSNGVWDRGDADKEKIISDMVDDNIDVIGKAFLGLTLGCARCHDHKFDPISTEDYYGLAGIFYSTHILKELGTKGGEYTMNRVPLVPAAVVAKRAEQVKQLGEIQTSLDGLEKQTPKPVDAEAQKSQLVARRDAIQRELIPDPPLAIAVQEGGMPGGLFPNIQDVPIHIRGSYARLGPVVPRRLPRFFAGANQPRIERESGRRELASWIASKENVLTARVIVNRVWQWHFGEGLVRTSSNFGMLGDTPSHPELLDWLATQFVEDGWSLKKLHRRIMLSSTYRQASRADGDALEHDPENRWLTRFAARRLEAEAIRDAMLSVSGELDTTMGGPAGDDFTIRRRSLYVQTARWERGSYANVFDAANPDSSSESRTVSTVAPQALLLLNHPFVLDRARTLAERLLREVPDSKPHAQTARIDHAYRLLYGRSPSDQELSVARSLLKDNAQNIDDWIDLAHVLLCSNEFVFVD